MLDRTFAVLEFHKLLAVLAEHAVSESGARACLGIRPYVSCEELNHASAVYEHGSLWLIRSGFTLGAFPDIDPALSALTAPAYVLDLNDLWALRQVLLLVLAARASLLSGGQEQFWDFLLESFMPEIMPEKSISALQRCLNDEGLIRDEASPELLELRNEIRKIHRQCSRKVGDFVKQYDLKNYLQDEYVTLSSDRYVLPLKTNFKGRLQGIVHDYSQTGETCYFEPLFLIELNNRLQELKRSERAEEQKILTYISQLLRDDLPQCRNAVQFLVDIDVLQATLRLSSLYKGRMILFDDASTVCLREARHPLLALVFAARKNSGSMAIEGTSRDSAPVPSDITLKGEQRALIISGGNAGGKTVCLKTLGLIALMGLCALPVPVAEGSRLPFWRSILPFIGDDQSLEDHVSTFTAQITLLAQNWNAITSDTLVILDEFGAGTDPAQGAALAQAVIDELMVKGACVFAATHFPALKAYALSKPGVRAASVLFDPVNKKPLFRLVYDQVGSSQALDVAREHGLPEVVVKRAEQYLLIDGEDTGKLIARLNALAVEREREAASLQDESRHYQEKKQALEKKYVYERERLHADIQAQAQAVLRDWKNEKISHRQTLKALSGIKKSLVDPSHDSKVAEGPSVNIQNLQVGDTLRYKPWNKEGVVLAVDRRRSKVRMDFSGVSMWADVTDFFVPLGAGDIKRGALPVTHIKSSDNYSLRLDLRGKRADVAIAEMEQFIDSSLISGRESLEVLHGRGTGALRREVHAALQRNPAVASFCLAPEDQGGDGMTLVTMK